MISPADLEKVEFSVSFRGYNGDQVDDYIDMVVKEFTALLNEYEKYKDLCEKQNAQIQIMKKKIIELENSGVTVVQSAPVFKSEPEVITKTVVKTVVDTKASDAALAKAKELEKLTSEFKAKALELYNNQLCQLQALNFEYVADDYTVNAEIEKTVTVEPSVKEVNQVSPLISDENVCEEDSQEIENTAVTESEDDTIFSSDEIDALCNSDNDELNGILDELSGLLTDDKDTQLDKIGVSSKSVQQDLTSLFITGTEDSE